MPLGGFGLREYSRFYGHERRGQDRENFDSAPLLSAGESFRWSCLRHIPVERQVGVRIGPVIEFPICFFAKKLLISKIQQGRPILLVLRVLSFAPMEGDAVSRTQPFENDLGGAMSQLGTIGGWPSSLGGRGS